MNMKRKLYDCLFLLWNVAIGLCLPRIKAVTASDIRVEPFNMRYMDQITDLHRQYDGRSISKRTFLLLRFIGDRTCFILVDEYSRVRGFFYHFIYFSELPRRLIHASLLIVDVKYRTRRYGTLLTAYAWDWFRAIKFFRGVSSSRIADNIAAELIIKKYGFKSINTSSMRSENRDWVRTVGLF